MKLVSNFKLRIKNFFADDRMKLAMVVGLSLVSLSSWSADNFNDLIVENLNSQSELHSQIKKSVEVTQQKKIKTQKQELLESYISDAQPSAVNIKTDKTVLTHQKEKTVSRASREQNEKRLAQEMLDVE